MRPIEPIPSRCHPTHPAAVKLVKLDSRGRLSRKVCFCTWMYTPPHTVSHRLACILWLSVHGLGASYVPTLHGRYIAHHVSNTRMCCQSHCVGCWPGVQRRLWGSVANQSSSAVGMTLRAASREDPARPWDTFRLLLPSLARLPRSGCAGLVWRARLQTDGRDTKEEDKKRELERRTPGCVWLLACLLLLQP